MEKFDDLKRMAQNEESKGDFGPKFICLVASEFYARNAIFHPASHLKINNALQPHPVFYIGAAATHTHATSILKTVSKT
jgi:hypothetical protein